MVRRADRETGGLLPVVLGAPVAVALGWIAYSALFVDRHVFLPPAVSGKRREFAGRAGRLSYYTAGPGAGMAEGGGPLLLIHSVNAAASSYEVRPLFEHYRVWRRVYALDLPGFGFSDRSPRDYTPRLYTDAVLDMLDEIARNAGEAPVDAVGLSLGCEFLARAAWERPGRFRTLALVTPTGMRHGQRGDAGGGTLGRPRLRRVIAFPLWGRPLLDLLNSRPSQRSFLRKTFGSADAVDAGLLRYDYLTAHQPDAEHAPFAFLSGQLFSADIERVYASLRPPVWLVHGTRGEFSDVDAGRARDRAGWVVQAFETGAIPYFERPDPFFAAYDAFLEGQSGGGAPARCPR